jgi:hypothetical protein
MVAVSTNRFAYNRAVENDASRASLLARASHRKR